MKYSEWNWDFKLMLIASRRPRSNIFCLDVDSIPVIFPNCWLCIFKHHFVHVQMAILRKYFWSKQTCWHFYMGTVGLKGERQQTTTSSVWWNVKLYCHYALMIFYCAHFCTCQWYFLFFRGKAGRSVCLIIYFLLYILYVFLFFEDIIPSFLSPWFLHLRLYQWK